jgi:hypothetical protein
MTLIRLVLALFAAVTFALSFAITTAFAQTPAAATGTAPAAAAPAGAASGTQSCVKPGHYPGKKASDNKKEAWIAEIRAWGDCVKTYVADLRAQVDAKIKLANSTIEEYNTGVKELQEEQKVAEMQGQVGK